MKVPFLDLRATYLELKAELDAATARVLASGWYVLGPELESFEREFADYCGATQAIGVGTGLDALHLALEAMGVGPGDEVIVPANTYIATWLAVSRCGATPVAVDPIERTYNLDPERVTSALTSRTRAIIPVHLYGQPADLDPLLALARDHGLWLLEDAAQAHGARYKGDRIGAHGHAVAWSFYPGKNLGAFGDGGAITTTDQALAGRIRLLRNYGSKQKYIHELQGHNSRLDELQAAVLRVKLRHLDEWNARRHAIAARYRAGLDGTGLTLPSVPDWADPAWHLFVVRHAQRDALHAHLAQAGIGSLIHYPVPPHRQQAYADEAFASNAFPVSRRMSEEVLSLPIGPHLRPEQAESVINAVCEALL